jgi:hypothetical protein
MGTIGVFCDLPGDGRHVGSFKQPASDAAAQQMQGGMTQVVGSIAAPGGRPSRFRVTHSSGETMCVDLEAAKALQRQKPGAKIFLERHD